MSLYLCFFLSECLPVQPLENGHVRGSGTNVGSRYWFTCNEGFTLIGSSIILCENDGQWNGTLPNCFEGRMNLYFGELQG